MHGLRVWINFSLMGSLSHEVILIMTTNGNWHRRGLRVRVGWQRAALRFRRSLTSFGRNISRKITWRRMPYILSVAAVVLIAWGYSTQRLSTPRLAMPVRHQTGQASPTEAEVTALSRLENEVSTLKNRLKELSEEQSASQNNFSPAQFSRPALGNIVQKLGWVRVSDEWRYHDGIDLLVAEGSNVLAAAEGIVTSIRSQAGLGTLIVIEHGNGWETRYGHIQGVLVNPGQKVERGTVLGQSSSQTCVAHPGIHFSVYLKGSPVDPTGVIAGLGR